MKQKPFLLLPLINIYLSLTQTLLLVVAADWTDLIGYWTVGNGGLWGECTADYTVDMKMTGNTKVSIEIVIRWTGKESLQIVRASNQGAKSRPGFEMDCVHAVPLLKSGFSCQDFTHRPTTKWENLSWFQHLISVSKLDKPHLNSVNLHHSDTSKCICIISHGVICIYNVVSSMAKRFFS